MEKPISKFELAFLSLDVTAYHVAKMVPSASDWNLELHAQKFATALVMVFWLALYSIAGHFIKFGQYDFARYITVCFVVEFIILFGYSKKIMAIEAEYSEHYNPVLWIAFAVFMIVAAVYWFNNQIGHLPTDYNKNK